MFNENAKTLIENCSDELESINTIIERTDKFSNIVPFLTKYALIKACGTLEQSYKTIIVDYCETDVNQRLKNYLENKIRNSSRNPSIENISSSLSEFDKEWNKKFKLKLNRKKDKSKLKTSLKSLNADRNEFAHGGNPTTSFDSIRGYYNDAIKIMDILDSVVK